MNINTLNNIILAIAIILILGGAYIAFILLPRKNRKK